MRKPLTPDTYAEAKIKFGLANQDTKHLWYHFKDRAFTIMAPPKSGSSSIRQFVWMNEIEDSVVVMKQYQATGKIYVVVRDPLSRFCSLWRSKCRDKAPIGNSSIHGFTPEELMSHIEGGHKDVHWTQQIKFFGNLTPTFIPLESLNWWWHQSGFGSLSKFNATEGEVEISDELKQRIITFYADDLELYHKAQCDLCWDTVVSPIVDV